MQDLKFRKKRKRGTSKQQVQKKRSMVYRGARKRKRIRGAKGSGWKKSIPLHFPKEKLRQAADNPKAAALWAAEMIAVCLLAVMLVLFFGQRVSNAGDSMSPALKNGDILLVNRLVYNARKPKRGEIIAFKPSGNENAHYLVKRVVGLPGETVKIENGQVYIDGEVLVKDIYAYEIASAGIAGEPIELGEDEYFVLGDNHTSSDDSRMADVGNVRREDIYGKVWFVASFGKNFGFVKD